MNNGLMHSHSIGDKAHTAIKMKKQKQRDFINDPTRAAFNRRFALYKVGLTQNDLAADLQVSPEVVSMTINDRTTSKTVANRLAELTGETLNSLWPCGKYQEHAQ